MFSLTLLLGIVATGQAWLLETNVDEIMPGGTHDVQLVCKKSNSLDNTMPFAIVSRIRITKLDPFGSSTTFAEIRAHTNVTSKKYDNYTVEGRMDKIEDAFLKVTWPVATKDTAGVYGCEIDGFDSFSNFVSVKPTSRLIKDKVLTIQEVNKLIQSATSGYQKKQQELESEIAALRNILTNDLQSLNRQFEDQSKTFESEIAKLRNFANIEYATKDKLSVQLSKLKNFTRNEIMSDNDQEQEQHNALLNIIQNLTKSSQEKFVEMKSECTNANLGLNRKIDRLHHMHEISNQKINSTLQTLDTQINSTVDNLRSRIDDLKKEFEKQISQATCPCPTSTPTKPNIITSTTPRADLSTWPHGAYRLVKPPSGCPSLTFQIDAKFGVVFQKYFNVKLNSPSGVADLSYCQQNGSLSSSSSSWPEGSYCLAKTPHANCPQGFTAGYIRYLRMGILHVKPKIFQTQYCCRSNGTPTLKIKLPTVKPFYLYRYKGVCQSVKGMHVRQDSITIQRNFLNEIVIAKNAHPDLDIDAQKISTIHLCYYYR